jgi:hypothetical protein
VVDKVKPTSAASAPATSSSNSITVTYTASDDRSGLDKVELYVKPPSAATYSLAGTDTTPDTTQSFSYTAAAGDGAYAFYTRAYDKASNAEDAPATPDATTTVSTAPPPPTFTFGGYFKPVDNLPVLNETKGGSAIPVKFSLGGNKGLNIFAADYPKSQVILCNSTAPVDGIESTATPGASALSYDAGSGQYTYVWKTDKSFLACRQLVLKFTDGTYARADFKFK